MRKGQPVISASEIGQFAYCRRAWWLARRCGCEPGEQERLAAGEWTHGRHGRTVQLAGSWRRLAYGLLVLSALMGILLVLALWAGGRL